MKKMILAATMMMVAMCASAQREVGSLTVQPKVGVNGSIMYMNDKNVDYKSFGGYAAGAELEYRISKWLALSAGAMYSQEGGDLRIKDMNVREKVNLDYITVPVLANFYVWKGLALKIGVESAFKVRDKYDLPTNKFGFDDTKYAFGDAKSFDLRIPMGISYDFGGLTLEFRTSSGITKAMKNKDYYNGYAQLSIGYKFALK